MRFVVKSICIRKDLHFSFRTKKICKTFISMRLIYILRLIEILSSYVWRNKEMMANVRKGLLFVLWSGLTSKLWERLKITNRLDLFVRMINGSRMISLFRNVKQKAPYQVIK